MGKTILKVTPSKHIYLVYFYPNLGLDPNKKDDLEVRLGLVLKNRQIYGKVNVLIFDRIYVSVL